MSRGRVLFAVFFFVLANTGIAQDRYIVFFKDKSATPYSISAPEQFLSGRAITRRIKQDVAITEKDLPVNPAYVQQLNATGAKAFYTSKWLNAALVQATPADTAKIAQLTFVSDYKLVAPGIKLSSGRTRSFKQAKQTTGAAATKSQLEMLGIDDMHADAVTGDGVLVAVFDAGFQGVDMAVPFQHLADENRVSSTHDFTTNTSNVYRYDDHGTSVLSVMAANSTTYTGGAFDATFQLYVTEDVYNEYRIEEYNWLFAAERADSSGVDIIHSSLGYNEFDDPAMDYNKSTDLDGKTAVVSVAAREALDKGILVVVSAGNEGNLSWGLVTPPADVDGVIAVGSITAQGTRSSFSSRGPTSDGRIKPDVVALGSGTAVIRPSGANGTVTGTSVAAPVVTSLAIGLLQRFPNVPVKQIADMIVSSGSHAENPDNLVGYGVPNYLTVRNMLEFGTTNDPISIYPNPANTGKFHILLKQANQDTDVVIYDTTGKVLNEKRVRITWSNNPLEVDISNLAVGTYLVKVKTINNFKTFRLIKI
jgi:hypothetical protein